MSGAAGPAAGGTAVSARVALGRLRAGSRRSGLTAGRVTDIYAWMFTAAVAAAIAAGAAKPVTRLFARTGWAIPGAPGRLFLAATVLLLLGGLAQLLRAAGPVTASSAYRFWLLSAPVRRRDLLRRRYVALIAVTAVLAAVVTVPVAHAASVAVLPAIAVAALAAVAVAAGAVWSQASDAVDRAWHTVGQALRVIGVLGFGSLATGAGRADLNAALRLPAGTGEVALPVLAAVALACCVIAYRSLDRIGISVLRRGQGLWTSGRVALASMDVFMVTEFLAEQRARQAGRIRSTRIGAGFAGALARTEWTRLRRRPGLALRAVAAAIVWWGCRPVLSGPLDNVIAVIMGYCLVLPFAGTLRQLTANPGLRVQFTPRDSWLGRASLAACLLAAAVWTALVVPGHHGSAVILPLLALGLTAAVYRTVTRPPLDYSAPLVPTPFGEVPLTLWLQLARGPLLLAVLAFLAALAGRAGPGR